MKIEFVRFAELSDINMKLLGYYRRTVFVQKLGWQLSVAAEQEWDAFDLDSTVHVLVRDGQQRLIGYARLLPTRSAYLLRDVFARLLDGQPAPSADDTWELSRFVMMDSERPGTASQFSNQRASIDLLRHIMDYCRQQGVRHLLSVSPVAVEVLLQRAGIPMRRLGNVHMIDGHRLFACRIDTGLQQPGN